MINKVILIGNVGREPEVRALENGVKVARLSLATTERIYNRDTQQTTENTEWHTITLWGALADVVDKWVKKGSQLYIEGSIHTREWSDQSGAKRYSTEIKCKELKLLGKKPTEEVGNGAGRTFAPQPENALPEPPTSVPLADFDLPF